MSFFEKFFSHRSRNNTNENPFRPETEGVSFRSSHLTVIKDQIRFVLFRECDKRGRKLLFDSYSVEKVVLPLKENMCKLKRHLQSDKPLDFIEAYKTHAYKYKKPPSDVFSLGEMVFGSVAVVHKAENSCKIHVLPSPKRLMFTTIVYAPFRRSPGSTVSELNLDHSSGCSLASITKIFNQQITCSSDSKLYKHEVVAQKYSSTYPWIQQDFSHSGVENCCERSVYNVNETFMPMSSEFDCTESLYSFKGTSVCEKASGEKDLSRFSVNNLSSSKKNSFSNNDSSGITSVESGFSLSGSFSSFRRRCAHSYSTSLDSTVYEDNICSPLKKRTKLGMALILDLSNTLENEIEKLLFNHTILIDSIMCKMQDSVELAYIKNENFVDLIYTAFLECQESIYELIAGSKYETPIWCKVFGDPDDGLENHLARMNLCKTNLGTCSKQDLVNNTQLKFLSDFCDVLVKFDTKDTNFFISTLLTAVLTHHLSWVSSVAETDLEAPSEILSVINNSRPYNPIWAQINDLCGILGSPLKCTKTVVTGTANKRNQLATVIDILTYFIRCNNVVENFYEVDIQDVINQKNSESDNSNFDSDIEMASENFRNECFTCPKKLDPYFCENKNVLVNNFLTVSEKDIKENKPSLGLKRSKSCYSGMGDRRHSKTNVLYPDIKSLALSEHININDLNYNENERTIFVDNVLTNDELKKKVQKMIRVPSEVLKPRAEGYLSPDEGYDTIDSSKTDNFRPSRVQIERQRSAPESKKEDIVFLLGENEELVNVHKKVVVNKSSFVDMEKEEIKKCSSSECVLEASKYNREEVRTCDEVDRTFWVNSELESSEHSINEPSSEQNFEKIPWIRKEIKLPRSVKPCRTRRLEVSSALGGVNEHYHSEQIIQAVLEPKSCLEQAFKKDLYLSAHNPIVEKSVRETLCIAGDMETWEVVIFSSNKTVLDYNKQSGVRVGMSQLVADMLESFLYLGTSNLSPSFCLLHIERKLREIYVKSKTVAELLNSTELCSMDYLTTSLDIGINDVPLLLSVATTHSPQIAEKYVLSYS